MTTRTGKIKWFDAEKRYGFVGLDDPEEDALLHVTALNDYSADVEVHKGAPIVVEVERGDRGLSVKKIISLERMSATAPIAAEINGEFVRARVKWYNDHKGYGFLTRGEGTPDVFIHAVVLKAASIEMIRPLQDVLVLIEAGKAGPKAVSIKIVA